MENSKSTEPSNWLQKGLRFLKLLAFIVLSTWLIKSFLFSVYHIPSGSMEPTLSRDDFILVSKYVYSIRSPEFYPLTAVPFQYIAADGLGNVQRGDIMVFDLPVFPKEMHPTEKDDYIKRCIGLPGDALAIIKGRYYLLNERSKYQMESDIFQNNEEVIVSKIPRKGDQIPLADSTQKFWEPILLRDGNSVSYDSLGNILVNGKKRLKYQVQQNYYFVKGDNNRFSSDSRNWGLVPKQNIIGRAEFIFWPFPPKIL